MRIVGNVGFGNLGTSINKAAAVGCGVPVVKYVVGVGWASWDAIAERRINRNFNDGFVGGAVIVNEAGIDRNAFKLRNYLGIFGEFGRAWNWVAIFGLPTNKFKISLGWSRERAHGGSVSYWSDALVPIDIHGDRQFIHESIVSGQDEIRRLGQRLCRDRDEG